jgi:haloalkane dehalogenase
MSDSQRTDFPAFTEHRVQRDRGSLYVRDFPGSGAAFVLLHGFPDNSHIYDDLIPHVFVPRQTECGGRSARS